MTVFVLRACLVSKPSTLSVWNLCQGSRRSLCKTNGVRPSFALNFITKNVTSSHRISSLLYSSSRTYVVFSKSELYGRTCKNQLIRPTGQRTNSITTNAPDIIIEDLPEPPVPPVNVPVPVDLSLDATLGEPTLASQGLAGWSPAGMLESCLEFLHINLDMPWWLAIASATLVARILLFPLVVKSQKNAANMNNNLPQMQLLQFKMTQARAGGNALESARYAEELMRFMKEKQLNPLKSFMIPLIQAPIFMSFFFGLRSMANLPVESLKSGGLWWFTNLTVPDPLWILPIVTSVTLFLTIELGVEGGIRSGSMQNMRWVLRAIPVVIFPFIMNFPSAILCYWVSTNAMSLAQVAFLRVKPVRAYFGIPEIVYHDSSKLPMKKGFVQGFKESYQNNKIIHEMDERARIDEIRFRKAGTGPIQKTYPFDPTKQSSSVSMQSKKKS